MQDFVLKGEHLRFILRRGFVVIAEQVQCRVCRQKGAFPDRGVPIGFCLFNRAACADDDAAERDASGLIVIRLRGVARLLTGMNGERRKGKHVGHGIFPAFGAVQRLNGFFVDKQEFHTQRILYAQICEGGTNGFLRSGDPCGVRRRIRLRQRGNPVPRNDAANQGNEHENRPFQSGVQKNQRVRRKVCFAGGAGDGFG